MIGKGRAAGSFGAVQTQGRALTREERQVIALAKGVEAVEMEVAALEKKHQEIGIRLAEKCEAAEALRQQYAAAKTALEEQQQ